MGCEVVLAIALPWERQVIRDADGEGMCDADGAGMCGVLEPSGAAVMQRGYVR